MKIAYIVPYVPNLIRTRPYNLINHLSALGHDVSVYTLGSSLQDLQDAEALRAKVSAVYFEKQPVWYSLLNCMLALPTRQPLQTIYSWNPGLADHLMNHLDAKNVSTKFDVVHVEHLRGSRYGRFIKSRLADVPVVWDSVDCISHLFKQAASRSGSLFGRFVTRFELSRTQRAEGELVGLFDQVLVTSETDKQALLNLIPAGTNPAPIHVLSNGVDLDYFHPRRDILRDPETLVFSGKMSYHANVSMVRHLVSAIMPKIWRRRPKTRLVIVGKDPSADIRNLAINPLVTVTGTVDDIRPYLWKATVAVVPLVYGAGIQNKILEAMACGTPVVTTQAALPSLQVQSGKDILAAGDDDGFALEVIRLLEDQKLQREVGDAGAAYVRNYHNWASKAKDMLAIYEASINVHRL
jgi:glycosyltransferase involved in cell wall biosynthesis